jgi:type I restriction-modification system DNA methylase subunit
LVIKRGFACSLSNIKEFIKEFEANIFERKNRNNTTGEVYTPPKIAKFMTETIFNILISDYIEGGDAAPLKNFSWNSDDYLTILRRDQKFIDKIDHIKILDPSCGSGIFLIESAKHLLQLNKILHPKLTESELKQKIVNDNIYGIELDKTAQMVAKLKLLNWINSKNPLAIPNDQENFDIETAANLTFRINIDHAEFLLDFTGRDYDLIIGNPPFIENKKILDHNYKKKISSAFQSAYRLFDLSILFLEKSMDILKPNQGYLSLIMPNKFLSAEYGSKIRKMIFDHSRLIELIDLSFLRIFPKTSTYPVIISLKQNSHDNSNSIAIKKYEYLNDLLSNNPILNKSIEQKALKRFPNQIIPIYPDIDNLIKIFEKFPPLSSAFKDVKMIYRPLGFLKWANNFKFVRHNSHDLSDLLLLGTNNVGKYHIKFDKQIRIAKHRLPISYFNYQEALAKRDPKLNQEKLVIREIAKKLTCVFDPGIFINLTGLYFLQLPLTDSSCLLSLQCILNSKLMNTIYHALFGTLHMSGGYLRFNGTFIKRLPVPQNIPKSFSKLSKIMQFLTQLLYDLPTHPEIKKTVTELPISLEKLILAYTEFVDNLVDEIYFENDPEFIKFVESEINLPNIKIKYFSNIFDLPKFTYYEESEVATNLSEIAQVYTEKVMHFNYKN